jgi:uncharacterized membrane protein
MTGPKETIQTPRILPTPPQSAKGWLQIALVISLALNLAIVGMVAGAMYKNRWSPHSESMVRDLGFGSFTDALSKDDRAALRRNFFKSSPSFRDGRSAMQTDFADLLAQLRASPFDATALRTVLDRQNARNAERLSLGQTLIFELLVGMDDDARQAFADRLEQSLAKGPRRRDRSVAP